MRADAEDNRRALLDAAREVYVELGTTVALDKIAKRAGVGIGTLYRRFPDRDALLRGVLVDIFEGMTEAAGAAEAGAGARAETEAGAAARAGDEAEAEAGTEGQAGASGKAGARAEAGAGAKAGGEAEAEAGTERHAAESAGRPAWEALVRSIADLGLGPALPVIFRERFDLIDDPTVSAAMRTAIESVEGVYRRAQESGQLRADVSFLEIQMLAGMLSQSGPSRPPKIDSATLTDRLAGILMDGLRAGPGNRVLPGEPPSFNPFDSEDRAAAEQAIAEENERIEGLRG